MIKLNIQEAKQPPFPLPRKTEKVELILLCKRNKSIAKIRSLHGKSHRKRPLGLPKGQFTIPNEFFIRFPKM